MGAFIAALGGGFRRPLGRRLRAPWLIHARRVIPYLARAGARPAAYPDSRHTPAVLATAATFARVTGLTAHRLHSKPTSRSSRSASASPAPEGPAARRRRASILTGGPRPGDTTRQSTTQGEARAAPRARATAFSMGCPRVPLHRLAVRPRPADASLVACSDAEQILANAQRPARIPAALADAIPSGPLEPGAQFAFEFSMNLDQTAGSRHDPHTREQLIRAEYLGGHAKAWIAADGRGVRADVFELTALGGGSPADQRRGDPARARARQRGVRGADGRDRAPGPIRDRRPDRRAGELGRRESPLPRHGVRARHPVRPPADPGHHGGCNVRIGPSRCVCERLTDEFSDTKGSIGT